MIRGAQKKMVVIRTHESRLFEEAYFVLRKDGERGMDDEDMLQEADRIIRGSTAGMDTGMFQHRRRGGRWLSRLCWMGAGFLLGGGAVWLAEHLIFL